MLRRLATSLTRFPTRPLCFSFSGGGHHEIDYHAVVTKNTKSGTVPLIKATTSTPMKSQDESPESSPIFKASKTSRKWPWIPNGGSSVHFAITPGLNELDYTELTVLVEEEFKIEFPDDVAEKFKDVNDMVEYVARSFWAGWLMLHIYINFNTA